MAVFKKAGAWWIDYYDENDVRKRKKLGHSKKVAQDTLEEVKTQVRQRKLGITQKTSLRPVTVHDFFLKDCIEYFDTNLSAGSTKRYKSVLNHFFHFMTSQHREVRWISQIHSQHIEKYKTFRKNVPFPKGLKCFNRPVEELEKMLDVARGDGAEVAKDTTVNFEIETLGTVFNLAKDWGYLAKNPVTGVKLLTVTDAQKPRFLTADEIKLLLEKCSGEIQLVFKTFILTGMRSGELANLEWDDIDAKQGVIRVRNKEFWQPKRRHERDIPLHDELVPLLKRHGEQNRARSNFVFCSSGARQFSENALRRELARATKKAGFPDVTKIHSLRHTFGSQLVLNGVDLPTVRDLMGHTDIETTMIYVHRTADHLVKSVNRLRLE